MREPEPPPKLVTFPELRARGVVLSRRQIDRLETDGLFPKRVAIGDWRVAWVTAEIDKWVEQRITNRSGLGDKRKQRGVAKRGA